MAHYNESRRGSTRGGSTRRGTSGRRGRGQARNRNRATNENDDRQRYHTANNNNDYRQRRGSSRGRRGRGGRGSSRRRPDRTDNHGETSDDLRAAIADMGKTIKSLTDRLETLQRNRDDKAANHQPTSARQPPSANSNNEDFPAVCKSIYRMVQLQHHITNWQQVPKMINERLTSLAADIRPPLADDGLRASIASLVDQFGTGLRALVTDHLHKTLADTESTAALLRRDDIERAKEIATKYLRGRLGRLDDSKRKLNVDRAAEMIGAGRPATPPTRPAPSADREDTTSWQTATKTSRKRTAPDTTPPPLVTTRNRFDALTDDDIADEADDEENDVEMQQQQPMTSSSPTGQQPAVKKHRPATKDTIHTGAGVEIFRGPKDEWTLHIDDDTDVIVIGDSNLRPVTRVPPKWQVFALPGARLTHVVDAMQRTAIDASRHFTIVVQAGINHRLDDPSRMQVDLVALYQELKRQTYVDAVYFAGLSTPNGLPREEAENVNAFNTMALVTFGNEHYVEPLAKQHVRISMGDTYGIHHTTETANLIMESICNVVNATHLNDSGSTLPADN
jgi:hypothetical protein